MVSLREAVSESVQNFLCSAATAADPFRNWIENATSTIPGVGQATRAADGVGDAVGQLVCPSNPAPIASPPVYPPPGNTPIATCPDNYNFVWRYIAVNDQGQVVGDTTSQNPTPPGPDNGPILGPFGLPVLRAGSQTQWTIIDGNGQETSTWANLQAGATFTFNELTVRRLNGGPNDCPVTEEPPQSPPTGGDNITYDGPNGPVIDEPITIQPGFPFTLPNGNIVIPVVVITPSATLNLDFNVNIGEVSFNFGGNDSADNCCPPIDDINEDDDPEDPDEPMETKRLWGIKVNCQINESMLEASQVSDGDGPVMYWPDIGQVRFAAEVAGKRSWSLPQKLNTVSQFVAVNLPAVAYDWDILERPGVSYTVQEVVVSETEGGMMS